MNEKEEVKDKFEEQVRICSVYQWDENSVVMLYLHI